MAGFAARTALELGLDSTHPIPGIEGCKLTNGSHHLLFCCAYDLDSRGSYMVGLPRVFSNQLQHEHIDSLVCCSIANLNSPESANKEGEGKPPLLRGDA